MRFVKGVLLVLLVVANPLFAQLTEVKVDNSSMPGEHIAGITVTKSGQVIVSSVAGVEYEIVEKVGEPGDANINSFTLNGQTTANLDIGETATVDWGTSNADSCIASTIPAGTVAGWDSTVTVNGPLTVTFTNPGTFNLSLECANSDNGSSDDAIVTARVGSANITSFTINPGTAEKDSDVEVTLSWTSQNATLGCAGSANWPNSQELPASGSRTFTITDIQDDTQFSLTCFGEIDEDSRAVTITATDPALQCDVTLTSNSVKTWDSVFKTAWPGPSSGQIRVGIPTYGYLAVRFRTGEQLDAGLLGNIEASGTTGARLGALSEIPGCFDVEEECKYFWGRTGGIIWDTQGTSGRCQLKPNTTYYWNITFTDGQSPGSSGCAGSSCQTYLKAINPD